VKVRTIAKLGSAIALAAVAATPLWSASHREAPGITKLPKLDHTDVYAFMAFGDTAIDPDDKDKVVLVANFQPGQDPGSGPNYYSMDPDALYEIHIDNNGDGKEDITYQFKFSSTLANGGKGLIRTVGGVSQEVALRVQVPAPGTTGPRFADQESYTVTQILGDRRRGTRAAVTDATPGANNTATFMRPFDNVGTKNIPNYPAYSQTFVKQINIPGCTAGTGKVFAGQRADSFAVNLGGVFDSVNLVPIQGVPDPVYANGIEAEGGRVFPLGGTAQDNRLQEVRFRKNVAAIAIEVPKQCLTAPGGNGVIGVWSSSSLPQARLLNPFSGSQSKTTLDGGAYTQVSRLGSPLTNELIIGLSQKDKFNASKPENDAQFQSFFANPTYPTLLDELFRAPINQGLQMQGKQVALTDNTAPTNFPRNDIINVFLTGFPGVNQLNTVTPSDMLRLNTNIAPTPRNQQNPLGVIAGDLAGWPNGRRLNDDVVDITARVAMGRLCYPVPIGANRALTSLGICTPAQAPTGLVPYTDAAPDDPKENPSDFPYSAPPIRGAVIFQTTTLPDGSTAYGK
jgi:Domain of unknown function (DUF4331)